MKTLSNMGFALFGAALVAISYGLARFAFGLFVPSISTELSITPAMIGVIGALPFVSFVLATLMAPKAADWLGARYLAMLSGTLGVAGLAVISQAGSASLLSKIVANILSLAHASSSTDAIPFFADMFFLFIPSSIKKISSSLLNWVRSMKSFFVSVISYYISI